MKNKFNFERKLLLTREKLGRLSNEQLENVLGGRLAAATYYTANGGGKCSQSISACCSEGATTCCG